MSVAALVCGWAPAPWPSQRAHEHCCYGYGKHRLSSCSKQLLSSCHSSGLTSRGKNSSRGSRQAQTCCRAKKLAAEAAAVAVGGSSTHPLSLQGLLQLEPQMAFLARSLSQDVLLPVVGGWLLVTVLSAVASRARQWCDDNPDEPLSLELLGLLPAALESPTRVAVALFVITRVLRNVAAGLSEFIHTFKPQWGDWADAAAHNVIHWLGPFDHTLVRLYIVVAVLAGARVLIKWKTIALEFILRQRAGLAHSRLAAASGALSRRLRSVSTTSRSSSSRSAQASASQAAAAAAAGGGESLVIQAVQQKTSTAGVDDDFDEAAVVCREGSMLSVSMRPRCQVVPSDAVDAAAVPGAAGGWDGSSAEQAAWSASGARLDDGVERLLLPLDSILSWAIAVMAGLVAVQALGINIQPLLAVGGASSLIIGLATQTLLTNAVMGVSIFLSRPFVPGDSVTVQAAGAILVSGVVEKVTPMRTLLRTDDDVVVTLPNKTIADMVIYNKSKREARNRLITRSFERPLLKFKVKLPHKELQQLQELQTDLVKVLKRPGVAQQSVEVALSKFTDAGAEVLLQCFLLVAVRSPTAQQLLLDLAFTVRRHGATLVSIL